MAAHLEASSPDLLMDAWCPVETAVPIKNRLHLGCDGILLLGPWPRVVLPLPPGVETAAGHAQLPAEPGSGEAGREGLDQAKPLGGSCSLHLRGAAEWAVRP